METSVDIAAIEHCRTHLLLQPRKRVLRGGELLEDGRKARDGLIEALVLALGNLVDGALELALELLEVGGVLLPVHERVEAARREATRQDVSLGRGARDINRRESEMQSA